MAEAMQGAMSLPPQMGNMSAEMAAVEEMRKQVSPSEVNNEMLMAAEQADPIAVAEFRRELEEMEIPPEVLALLNTMVDEILSDPANYAAIRARYMAQGVDEELLPEAFDAQLFGALQVALDQLRAPNTMAPHRTSPEAVSQASAQWLRLWLTQVVTATQWLLTSAPLRHKS